MCNSIVVNLVVKTRLHPVAHPHKPITRKQLPREDPLVAFTVPPSSLYAFAQ